MSHSTVRAPSTPQASRLAVLVAVALVVSLGAVACSRKTVPVTGRLTVLEGNAEIGRPGEERSEITGSRDLRVGDGVRVRDGSAVIRLPGNREMELRTGTDVEFRATDAGEGFRPTLLGGDVLVRAPEQPLTIFSGDEEIVVRGATRVSRGLALLAATYEGSATVSSAARSLVVPALRQVAVPAAGVFPVRPSPLEASPDDTWDQRYLSAAIGLSAELQARSRGFTAQLAAGEGKTVNYFRELLPRLAGEPAFQASSLNALRPPGETLIGAAITLEGTRGSFADRWAAVFSFHDDGAPWGLVAFDQGVSRVPLLELIESAVRRGPTNFALAEPGRPPSSLPTPTTRPPAPRPVVTTTTVPRAARPTTPTTIPPATTPTTIAPTGPLNTGTPVIDDTVNALVNTLTGLLNSLSQK